MASAVLASRNEPYWGERKVYMRKYTNNSNNKPHLKKINPNPNPNPNSNPNPKPISSRQIHDFSSKARVWQSDEPPPSQAPPAASDDSSSLNRKAVNLNGHGETSGGEYVTFDVAAYSAAELKGLKKRLISELEQVRSLRARIEAREVESRSGYPASQFSGSYGGGREAASITRPPPLQLSYALESPGATASKEKRTPKANQYYPPNEFVTGKKKTVPPSTKKKASGHKRSVHFASDRDPKRHAVLDSQVDKLVTSLMRRCKQILTKLMKHKHGWVFNTPVDVVGLGLHDYNQIIKHPMDLGTVKSRLDKNEYQSPLDFASDVRLTFNNAMTYNIKGQDVYLMAEMLLSRFEEMFNPAYKKFEAEHRRVIAAEQQKINQKIWAPPPPARAAVAESGRRPLTDSMQILTKSDSMRVQPPFNSPPVQLHPSTLPDPVPGPQTEKSEETPRLMPKLPKPKAKDSNKRQMSFEEKAKLGMSLQNLPSEKLDQLMLIIKRRNSHLTQDGDEIELDIEALDNETLWELDRFVSSKKAMSKNTRQGLIDNSILAAQINKSPVSEPTPEATVQKNKKGDAGEEDVDIGEEIPANNFPPVEIEKDAANASSSSSSSSSGSDSSSSSDSDSGSSSGSDSDADSVQSPFVESKDAEAAVT